MQNPGHGIRLRSSARTHTGKVRDNNEDSVHLWKHSEHVVMAIVADGMGGAVAGEEASRIVIETLEGKLAHNSFASPLELESRELTSRLEHSIHDANNNIVDRAIAQPELKGMGTTVTLAFVRKNSVVVGHVGDSRAYRVHGDSGDIEQITSDHSFVQALVAAGHITEEEAEDHPMRNVLYRALGQAREVEIDFYYEQLRSGDRLVLCSDGLTLHVKPDEIAKFVLRHEPDKASQKLIDLTNERGGRDNVSVIVIQVEETDEDITETDIKTPQTNVPYGSSEATPPTSQDTPAQLEAPRFGEGRDSLTPDQ